MKKIIIVMLIHNKDFMQKSCALTCDSCSKYEPAMPAPGVAFDALDRDGDGTISLAELKSQLRWSSAHSRGEKSKLSKERVKDIMYEVSGVLTDASKDDVVYATCLVYALQLTLPPWVDDDERPEGPPTPPAQ